MGGVVNLEGARLLFRRVLDNPAVVRSPLLGAGVLGRWGFLFLNQFGCVSPEIGLQFCYELAGQRWIEGKIDLSSSGHRTFDRPWGVFYPYRIHSIEA